MADSVSVVIPLHNRQDLIAFTLESLDERNHPGISIQTIVVDDGSKDDSAILVAERFPHVTLVRQPNLGAPTARNRGIELASAETIVLLDSDDLLEPGFFRSRLDALARHKKAAGAYGPWHVFESEREFNSRDVKPRHTEYPIEESVESDSHLNRLLRGWYIVGSAVLWRTSVLRQVGSLDQKLRINQDVELMFRILMKTPGLVGTTGARALIREHAGERQGQALDDLRVSQILSLRKRFVTELRDSGRLTDSNRCALAEYCFDGWASWRESSPSVARELLALSNELWPELTVRGGRVFRALGALLGPARATIVKQKLRAWQES